jgi:hypothetical protein
VLGKDGNEIRLIERSATITPAHRAKDVLRIGSSEPRENKLPSLLSVPLGDDRQPMSVVSSRHVGRHRYSQIKSVVLNLQGTNSLICRLISERLLCRELDMSGR